MSTKKLGAGMYMAAWIGVFILLTIFFGKWLDGQYNPNEKVQSQISDDGERIVTLQRNRDGHYVTSGKINGQSVTFLLDTGASDVSVPATLADRLGMPRGQARYYATANGRITAYMSQLDSLKIGDITLHNVPASINPSSHDNSVLLGMSALKQLEFTQRGDTLIIRQNVMPPTGNR
jgi:aspartyl protease family protein